jgi:hypothetical protein
MVIASDKISSIGAGAPTIRVSVLQSTSANTHSEAKIRVSFFITIPERPYAFYLI